ncbi:MAG: hypothetical protein ACRCVN_01165 [Spirochaetia bacterium]
MIVSDQPTFLTQDLACTREFIHNHSSMIINAVPAHPLDETLLENRLGTIFPTYYQQYLEVSLNEELSCDTPHLCQFFDVFSGFEIHILSVVTIPHEKGQISSAVIRKALKNIAWFAHTYEISDVYLPYLGCIEGVVQKEEFFAMLKNFLRDNVILFRLYLCE